MIKTIIAVVVLIGLPVPFVIPMYGNGDVFRHVLQIFLIVALFASLEHLRRKQSLIRYGLVVYYFGFSTLMLLRIVRG